MALLLSLFLPGNSDPLGDDREARDPVESGWRLYRAGEFAKAAEAFEARLREAPRDMDARTGAGYAFLQSGRLAEARTAFEEVLGARPGDGDATKGLGLTIARGGGDEKRFRPDAETGRPLRVPARALRDHLEVREADGRWRPFFVKGVNLGAALPGKFPTEFPADVAVYRGWLDTIAAVGANAVRVYTLLPPEFYRALADHNAAGHRLWLIQGVWAELPDRLDFSDPGYVEAFRSEIARVVDAVHGDLALPPRPGHASGHYDADASPWLLAYVLGREWEPYAVQAFNEMRPRTARFDGTWFRTRGGAAMEAWIASICDFAAGYEARRYRTLHPLTFANWPTLDPLPHPSEANRAEEDAWRRTYGIPFPEKLDAAPWEDDAVSLDATRIVPTEAMLAGSFAAYHVYPNYPDFMNAEGTYEDYLRTLKRYHGSQPVLIAEFGISTSRGVAHVARSGWNHGGHDERRQGELVAEMIGAIRRAGCAGGIVFELMDEWFKGTWSVAPLEIPAERRRLWFDAESPEQSYGIVANRPQAPVVVDGDPSEWTGADTLLASGDAALRELRATSDEGYLYLLLRTAGRTDGAGYRIALDTYDPERGETSLPAPGAASVATGVEFIVDLLGETSSTMRVTAPYEPYQAIERGPIASPRGGAGRFVPLSFEPNRERFGRDGRRYPAIRIDRGALLYGSLDPRSPRFDTRTDVAIGPETGTIEMRIPWGLLNVSDPSSRRVLHQEREHEPPLETTVTDGFRIYAFALDRASRLDGRLFTWPTWDTPSYRTERKRGFETIRRAFGAIRAR